MIRTHLLKGLAFCVVGLSFSLTSAVALAQKSVMVTGDSISAGFLRPSYRQPLLDSLSDLGCAVDMVGSETLNSFSFRDPTGFPGEHVGDFTLSNGYDLDHQAWPGITVSSLNSGQTVNGNRVVEPIRIYVDQFQPDYVVVHAGTNDLRGAVVGGATTTADFVSFADITTARLESLINNVINAHSNPADLTVLVANFIPYGADDLTPTQLSNALAASPIYTQQIEQMVANLANPNVRIVDVEDGFNVITMTTDGVHPNAAGERHIAAAVLPVLLDAGLCDTSAPVIGIPELTNPAPGSVLSSSAVTFNWESNGLPVTQYYLRVGDTPGGDDYEDTTDRIAPTTLSHRVTGIPVDGRDIYVEFSYRPTGANWVIRNFIYTAHTDEIELPDPTTLSVGQCATEADTLLSLSVEDSTEYGWSWGTRNNREEVVACFESVGADVDLSVLGYDIDSATEVEVLLNGESIGHLARGANNGFSSVESFRISSADQLSGQNEVRFVQARSGFRWGVTNLLLETAGTGSNSNSAQFVGQGQCAAEADTLLSLSVEDSTEYGWSWGTRNNREEVVACFESVGADVDLSVLGYDIDSATEVEVLLNGESIGHLARGANNGFSSVESFRISSADQLSGQNEVRFVQARSGFRWGVTNLLLETAGTGSNSNSNSNSAQFVGQGQCAAEADTLLSLSVEDSTEYGWSWGTRNNREEVVACFESVGADVDLSVLGYDIDSATEVEVLLNGESIGHLARGANNGFSSVESFRITSADQLSGQNEVRFVQARSGFRWGVTSLLLETAGTGSNSNSNQFVGQGQCAAEADTLLLLSVTDSTEYGWSWGTRNNREEVIACFESVGADVDLSVLGYDIDSATEVEVLLNGESIGHLARGANNGFSSVESLRISSADQVSGQNEVRFVQARSGFRWGVTNLLLETSGTGPDSSVDPASDAGVPELTSPTPGSVLPGSSVTFNWTGNGFAVNDYYLRVGNSPGSAEYADMRFTNPATVSHQVTRLPVDGRDIYVEFSYLPTGGNWVVRDLLYTAATSQDTANAPAIPALISPDETSTTTTPTYSWNSVVGGTFYNLRVNDNTGTVIDELYSAVELGCDTGGTCSIAPPTSVASGVVTWWVRSANETSFSDFTDPLVFTAGSTGFEPPPLDLSNVRWLHSNVSGWTETATLQPVSINNSGSIALDFDKADVWPSEKPLLPQTDDLVGNAWVFIWNEAQSQWFGATWEWMRPGQISKLAASVNGEHIKRSPYDAASGWEPTSGETLYFMISGLVRNSVRNVTERSAPVKFIWP